MKDLKLIWTELEEAEGIKKQKGIIRKDRNSRAGLSVGLDLIDGKKLVMLTVHKEYELDKQKLPDWGGTDIEIRSIANDKQAIVVKLVDEDALDIFNSLIKDLEDKLSMTVIADQALEIFLSTLTRWYRFFKKHGIKVLSQEEQCGLFGELYFLFQRLIPLANNHNIIDHWKGYSGSVHDFVFPGGNIEVKTTRGKEHNKVIISNEKQLNNEGLQSLYLYCICLKTNFGQGTSLPELIHDIKEFLANDISALNTLESNLFDYGYLEEHTKYYNKNRS